MITTYTTLTRFHCAYMHSSLVLYGSRASFERRLVFTQSVHTHGCILSGRCIWIVWYIYILIYIICGWCAARQFHLIESHNHGAGFYSRLRMCGLFGTRTSIDYEMISFARELWVFALAYWYEWVRIFISPKTVNRLGADWTLKHRCSVWLFHCVTRFWLSGIRGAL